MLQGCPPRLLEVRGEVYMTNSELVRLNELRRPPGEPPFANPRNSTAGSLKMLDSKLVRPAPAPVHLARTGRIAGDRRDLVFRDHAVDEAAGASRSARTRAATTRSSR